MRLNVDNPVVLFKDNKISFKDEVLEFFSYRETILNCKEKLVVNLETSIRKSEEHLLILDDKIIHYTILKMSDPSDAHTFKNEIISVYKNTPDEKENMMKMIHGLKWSVENRSYFSSKGPNNFHFYENTNIVQLFYSRDGYPVNNEEILVLKLKDLLKTKISRL